MEVVSHLWLEDGRLLILAVGLCRIKVCSSFIFFTSDMRVQSDFDTKSFAKFAAFHMAPRYSATWSMHAVLEVCLCGLSHAPVLILLP